MMSSTTQFFALKLIDGGKERVVIFLNASYLIWTVRIGFLVPVFFAKTHIYYGQLGAAEVLKTRCSIPQLIVILFHSELVFQGI